MLRFVIVLLFRDYHVVLFSCSPFLARPSETIDLVESIPTTQVSSNADQCTSSYVDLKRFLFLLLQFYAVIVS